MAGPCWAELATCYCVCKPSFRAQFPKATFQGIFLEALPTTTSVGDKQGASSSRQGSWLARVTANDSRAARRITPRISGRLRADCALIWHSRTCRSFFTSRRQTSRYLRWMWEQAREPRRSVWHDSGFTSPYWTRLKRCSTLQNSQPKQQVLQTELRLWRAMLRS